jgi:tetratricopeptide (TPR) repeat protein
LNNLAKHVCSRFDHRGNAEDLDQAIALGREALALLPVGHTDRSSSLNNLAVRLSTRFDHRGNAEDLDQAIALHREALALLPVTHTDRSMSLNNLAAQLSTCIGEDLDQAIELQREALALHPVGHIDRSKSLNNLAIGLSIRFEHRGNAEDLNESQEHLRCALTLLTQHDPYRLTVHHSLAALYLLFHRAGLEATGGPGEDTDSLNVAMHHYKAAANFTPGGLLYRLQASLVYALHGEVTLKRKV